MKQYKEACGYLWNALNSLESVKIAIKIVVLTGYIFIDSLLYLSVCVLVIEVFVQVMKSGKMLVLLGCLQLYLKKNVLI